MENCYKNLKSAAESGWDFSARWFFTEDGGIGTNISLIDTRRIIPVDLNAFLCKAFGELSTFHKLLENEEKSSEYQNLHESWRKSIEVILYDEVDGIWYDFDIKLSKPRKGFFPSNLAPLWAIAYNISEKDQHGSMAVKYLKDKQIDLYMGGTPTSLVPSGEQWDFPNAWPPLQEIVILGLRKTGNSEALKLSTIFGKRCLNAYIRGYSNTNEMFEKYDAVVPGQYGGGGEYTVQTGFGWTNGLALSLIKMFHMKDG
ncbi:Trehalase [Gonioctena quinquepunctata]|nr:Trehalase [Gonioctena quinquepunctata]